MQRILTFNVFFSHDKLHRIRLLSSQLHLFLRGSRFSIENVIPDATVDENRLLTHDPHFAAQIMDVEVFDVDAINRDLTSGSFVETHYEVHDCGFATP